MAVPVDNRFDARDVGPAPPVATRPADFGRRAVDSLQPGTLFVQRANAGLRSRSECRTGLGTGFLAAFVGVAHADADGLKAIQYVQLGQAQAGDAELMFGPRCAGGHRVEPATAALGRPVVAPNSVPLLGRAWCTDVSSNSSVGNGPGAHPRGVGLGDAQDVVEVAAGPNPEPTGGTTGGGVGARSRRDRYRKSMSSSEPWAPSNRILRPKSCAQARAEWRTTSAIIGQQSALPISSVASPEPRRHSPCGSTW